MKGSNWLSAGGHSADSGDNCLLERVSEVAGEMHSDHPATAKAWLAGKCRSVNDMLDDVNRQLLGLLIEQLVGSANLKLHKEDMVRVAAAYRAVSMQANSLTAAVFVGSVQMALQRATALKEAEGPLLFSDGDLDGLTQELEQEIENEANRLAQEEAHRFEEERRREARLLEERLAEEERRIEAERMEEEKREGERQRRVVAEAQKAPLSPQTMRSMQGLMTALSKKASVGIPMSSAPRQLEASTEVELIIPKEKVNARNR